MLRLNTIIFSEIVPTTNEVITAVTEYGETGLLIQDYLNGKPVNDDNGIFVSYADFDDAILTYDYKNGTVYLEKSVMNAFSTLMEHAQLFEGCGGSLERFAEIMDRQLNGLE